jgi:hypothetical protein
MRVEEEYMDVLQNIESAITDAYRQHRDLSDYDVMRALESLVDAYSGEKVGRPPRNIRLSDRESRVLDGVRGMCEWRLGRAEPPVETPLKPGPEPITVDEIILCLKRILKSVKMWNKEGGRQGYLNFIIPYLP